jgi:uncharacterized protein HemY
MKAQIKNANDFNCKADLILAYKAAHDKGDKKEAERLLNEMKKVGLGGWEIKY